MSAEGVGVAQAGERAGELAAPREEAACRERGAAARRSLSELFSSLAQPHAPPR